MSGDAGGINKLELSSCQTGVQPVNAKKTSQDRRQDTTKSYPFSPKTPNLGTTPQHNLSITTTNPCLCLHTLPNARAHDNRWRQPNPPQPTVNEKGKARNDFFDQNQRHLTDFALYQKKSNTTFFSCYLFFPGQFVILYSVRFFFQSEDIVHLLIFSDLFCKTV